jgi:hypothetical protein
MAILSSLFGTTGQQQPAVPGQAITTSEIPKQLAPYYEDILSKAQALYNKRVEEGFKPYEGPTIAQFTPEQEATFAGIAGLQGQVAPKFAEAEDLTRQAAAQITGEQLQEAMSPYQQAVTDIEKRESQKAFEQNVLPKLRAAQVAQGSFGGTRGTLLEAQALAEQQQQLADIQAKGSAQAFRDARAALEAERTRMGQGATQLANIAPAALKTSLAELGAQQTVGETKQQQAQTALDEAYRQFLQEKQEPYEAMQKYQAVVTGAPLTTTQFAPPPAPGPSLGQTLIGGLGTAAGLYGAFTGNNPLAAVGLAKGQTGGGIADLMPDFPVIQAKRGTEDETIRRSRVGQLLDKLPKDVKLGFGDFVPFNLDKSLGSGYDYLFEPEAADKSFSQIAKEKMGLQDEVSDPNIIVSVGPDGTVIRENIKTGETQVQESEQAKQTKGGDVGGPVQGPSLPKGGLSSLKTEESKPEPKADQPPAPTKAQLREQAMRTEEEGLKSLYGQYTQRAEKEKAQSKDAEYKAQMANMAKAFAQFATKGGEGNILQKAIGTAGDNVDAFVGTSDKFRKERKAIEKDLQAGELAEARLKYDITKDRASREIAEEQRELAAEKLEYDRKAAASAAAEDKRRFGLNYKLELGKIDRQMEKDGEVSGSDLETIKKALATDLGMTFNEENGQYLMEDADGIARPVTGKDRDTLNQYRDTVVNYQKRFKIDTYGARALANVPPDKLQLLIENPSEANIKRFKDAFPGVEPRIIDKILK